MAIMKVGVRKGDIYKQDTKDAQESQESQEIFPLYLFDLKPSNP
jgi:hypothetical protein